MLSRLCLLLFIAASCQQAKQIVVQPVPPVQPPVPAPETSYEYVTYRTGKLPIIVSVPHGGYLKPAALPDRNCDGCVYVQDAYTQELANTLDSLFLARFGCRIHLVINRLHRIKLDPNRPIDEGADGNMVAQQAWRGYHNALDSAKKAVINTFGKGLLLDLHGHGHAIQRLELGYLVGAADLRQPDSLLNKLASVSSIYNLTRPATGSKPLSGLLRQTYAFGTLLQQAGYPAVPSQAIPAPLTGEDYFNGGYITQRYGSAGGGTLDAIQIESNMNGVRDTPANRLRYAQALVGVIDTYLQRHYISEPLGTLCR